MPRKPKAPAIQVMPRKTGDGYLEDAYEILEVHAADVMAAAKVEPMLELAGILGKVWDYLEASDTQAARKLLAMRARITQKSQQNVVPFEAYCVAADVDTRIALGVIADVMKSHVSLLRSSAALDKFEKSRRNGAEENVHFNSGERLAVLPPVEKDVKALSDRFNERFLSEQPGDAAPVGIDDEGDEDEEEGD